MDTTKAVKVRSSRAGLTMAFCITEDKVLDFSNWIPIDWWHATLMQLSSNTGNQVQPGKPQVLLTEHLLCRRHRLVKLEHTSHPKREFLFFLWQTGILILIKSPWKTPLTGFPLGPASGGVWSCSELWWLLRSAVAFCPAGIYSSDSTHLTPELNAAFFPSEAPPFP